RYIKAWRDFFLDIDVAVPKDNRDAIDEFRALVTPDWPYWRLLRELRDNTQFPETKKEEAARADRNSVLSQVRRRIGRKLDQKTRTPGMARLLTSLGVGGKQYQDPVPRAFESMVAFAFPSPPKEGEAPPPSGLSEYISNMEQLTAEMTVIEEGPRAVDTENATKMFEKAVSDAEKMTLSLDGTGQELMRPLLMNPLRQSYKAMVRSAGGAASGLWEVMVWPAYRDTIRNRYPFNAASKRDASFEDAVAFFQPKEGILWSFYGEYLDSYHMQQGHKFIPMPSLRGRNKAATRYTPFRPNMYNCLERAHEISDALFAQGDPGVVFRINLTTVSPIVSDIVFELDGQKRVYRNEKEFWHTFKWPGEESPLAGARLRIEGAGGLNEEIVREGPWGLWRLIDSGRHTATKDNDRTFVVEWQFAAPPVTVRMQIKPTRANHPFPRNFFRDTNCPASIGDSFGPG
ncbi:MAG TPA: type VI secretion system membrane subunit TssM, partial [Sorangium sp.]|nr:type VI secretion system membrane subunit TssM [Sorangium sp.]